jgi:hypothetical protein
VSTARGSRGDRRVSRVLLWWPLAVSVSFLIGSLLFAFVPAASGATWVVGIVSNIIMAVVIGIFFGWTQRGVHILIAMVVGAVVTTFGVDLLLLVSSHAENARTELLGFSAFDSFVVYVALCGMVILVGGGALAGVFAHFVLSSSGCLAQARSNPKRRPRTSRLEQFGSGRLSWSDPSGGR